MNRNLVLKKAPAAFKSRKLVAIYCSDIQTLQICSTFWSHWIYKYITVMHCSAFCALVYQATDSTFQIIYKIARNVPFKQ